MKKVDFDDYANEYNNILKEQLRFFSEDDKYFARYKVKLVHKYLATQPKRILEYGCGTGRNLPFFKEEFPGTEILGADISAQSIAIANEENPFAKCCCLDDEFVRSHGDFDLIFVAGVFHHIAPNERVGVLGQINSLLSERGSLFVFEHNPYNPVTKKLVRECPFDADASLLSMHAMSELLEGTGFAGLQKKYTLFFPPSFPVFARLESYLGWLPLGGQYFIQAKKHTAP